MKIESKLATTEFSKKTILKRPRELLPVKKLMINLQTRFQRAEYNNKEWRCFPLKKTRQIKSNMRTRTLMISDLSILPQKNLINRSPINIKRTKTPICIRTKNENDFITNYEECLLTYYANKINNTKSKNFRKLSMRSNSSKHKAINNPSRNDKLYQRTEIGRASCRERVYVMG